MFKTLLQFKRLISHSIPSLLAISIIEFINVEIYLYSPVAKNITALIIWLVLQLVPGFLFGYISDKYFRKKMFVISQCLGVFGGIILSIFGFEKWVLILIGLTFNPTPIARAAFIDNFPQHSILKLISLTFLAQWIPWIFFNFLSTIDYKLVVFILLGLLALNILFTIFFFKDGYIKKTIPTKTVYPWQILFHKKSLLLTLIAFTLSELTFYLVWIFFEYHPKVHSWLSVTTTSTIVGIVIAMLYKKLPDISIITLFYAIGAGMSSITFFRCQNSTSCDLKMVEMMINYCTIGGLYIPFVTDAIISLAGENHKAVGAAFIEFGSTLAIFLSPILNLIFKFNSYSLMITIFILYVLATIIQKLSENTKKYQRNEIKN